MFDSSHISGEGTDDNGFFTLEERINDNVLVMDQKYPKNKFYNRVFTVEYD